MKSEWINIGDGGIHYLEIQGRECSITLEPRPAYCDRGNYIAKLFPTGKLALEIDEQDFFPNCKRMARQRKGKLILPYTR